MDMAVKSVSLYVLFLSFFFGGGGISHFLSTDSLRMTWETMAVDCFLVGGCLQEDSIFVDDVTGDGVST